MSEAGLQRLLDRFKLARKSGICLQRYRHSLVKLCHYELEIGGRAKEMNRKEETRKKVVKQLCEVPWTRVLHQSMYKGGGS